MSKRVVAAFLGVPLFVAAVWAAYSASFNFYLEHWSMPLEKYGVRTPLRWQDVVFIATVWAISIIVFYGSYRLLKFAFLRKHSA
jgi:hypothetical protein